MKAVGSPSELHLYKDATRGFNHHRPGDHYADTVAKMDAFLVKHGWLQNESDFLYSLAAGAFLASAQERTPEALFNSGIA